MSGAAAAAAGALLERERAAAEAGLARTLDALLAGAPPKLAETARYAVEGGGKRLRPILCAAAWRAVGGGERDAIYDLAASLELIHAYSLAHDDLPCMDDDDVRRGRPATHRAHGEAAAVLAGAALIPLACRAVMRGSAALGLPDAAAAALVGELTRAAGAAGMVGGQVLDLEAEDRALDVPDLEAVHGAKTGALLTAALRMGAVAAGAEGPRLAAITAYGRALGLAFQIADDVLDVVAESAILGKPAGSDAALRKSTYPALLGVDGARRRARAEAERAVAALRGAGLESAELDALAAYAVERER